MDKFETAYKSLNDAQKEAVDYIDGPLLVIAGPGTGKTQLLSVRVANIMKKTDTPAQNILCLTFTENGAENMRERLSRFIGQAAYDVQISTYHAFGAELIRRYGDYFTELRLQNPVDELGRRQIIADIVDGMGFQNPLRQTRHHLEDLLATISEVKRALLTPEDLRHIADENLEFITTASRTVKTLFASYKRMPSLDKALSLFDQIMVACEALASESPINVEFGNLAAAALRTLRISLQTATDTGKTSSLTLWKNNWLAKDNKNQMKFGGELESRRLKYLADAIEQYQSALEAQGLYDFDDMILKAIEVLERNDDLRFTLQERYLYLLLDEYQDTNAAQAKLVRLLTDNPVNECRPNVMAVGDDDQAIYAFQGALYSNMVDFYKAFADVRIVNLTLNYRSLPDILFVADNISAQIKERLAQQSGSTNKSIKAANIDPVNQSVISRRDFLSDIAQAGWIAKEIKSLIESGVPAHEIAVLAPRHRRLKSLVPYLNALNIPLHYEKRENILDSEVIRQLLTMSRLVLAILNGNIQIANHLWPQVLSYDFWDIPVSRIWELSWHVADNRLTDKNVSWSRALLAGGAQLRIPALLFLALASQAGQETCEMMLDYLIGNAAVDTNETDLPKVFSPLRDYYTNRTVQKTQPELFYETVSHLTVLRARLREHFAAENNGNYTLESLISFVDMYIEAGERMIDTSPYNQDADAVQLMTVYKAKGMEFTHVFLPNSTDDVWGNTSQAQANRLTLPANIEPIRHVGATEDERIRLLYVAITRARIGLHIYSVSRSYTGKPSKRLKYLAEVETDDGHLQDAVLPEKFRNVLSDDSTPPPLALVELDWRQRHSQGLRQTSLQMLLERRLRQYRMSPTHLGSFLDLAYSGPERFFFNTILRFPEAPLPDAEFGNAIHETLEWYQYLTVQQGNAPSASEAIVFFESRMQQKALAPSRIALEVERGRAVLASYLASRHEIFKPADRAEVSFAHENIRLGDARISGKIDRLEVSTANRTIAVIDYKTGKSYERWVNNPSLYKYRRQLIFYKLLLEGSSAYSGYTIPSGRLEFVEPDQQGQINALELTITSDDLNRTKGLIAAVWQHIMDLNFPDVSSYQPGLNGIKQFEQDLIDGKL